MLFDLGTRATIVTKQLGGGLLPDQRRIVQFGGQGHGFEDPDHGEPGAAQPDLGTGFDHPESLRGIGAEHGGRIAGGGLVQPAAAGHLTGHDVQQGQIRCLGADATGGLLFA